jgi:hypothetical protein
MLEVLVKVEEALGENLVWITDLADLGVRQKDPETLRRLKQLRDAWELVVMTLHTKGGE